MSSVAAARPVVAKKVTVDLVIIRIVFILVLAVACALLQPFGLSRQAAAAAGLALGVAVILFELRLRAVSLKRLIGAAIGSVLGILGAYLFSLVIRNSIPAGNTQSFLQLLVMLLMAYVGLVVGANKGDLLNLAALGGIFGGEKQGKQQLQDSRHQRHHRRPHRRHRRDRLSGRRAGDPAVRAAGAAAGGRFGRLA